MDVAHDELDVEILDFLEHHGVPGMKWGFKKSKAKQGDWHNYRTGKQKLGLVAGGAGGLWVSSAIANSVLRRVGANPVTAIAGIAGQVGGTIYGVRLARNFMDRNGRKRVSQFRKPKR